MGGGVFAQAAPAKTAEPKAKAAKTAKTMAKPATTAATAAPATAASTAHAKKNGAPDMRYKENKSAAKPVVHA